MENTAMKLICVMLLVCAIVEGRGGHVTEDGLYQTASSLEMFVDELPDMPTLNGYAVQDGKFKPADLKIGMFKKKWKFHRDLPASTVYAYGQSKRTATVPGPTIEAIQGVETFVTWKNHLPSPHILPWDGSIMSAVPKQGGIPTVVHLHGGIHESESDGNSLAWFTAGFNETGPAWKKAKYHYMNVQHPGNLWYHDHALGLTRVNILAGLAGAYVIRNPEVEKSLNLPSGREYDRPLIVFDRSFATDGSLYMNSTGNNPSIHPQWQPEYFGDAITVNGKAWPYLKVKRRKYRFRIINASNARFYKFALSNKLSMTQIGSDSAYLHAPVSVPSLLLGPSEIADVVIDFNNSSTDEAILTNNAVYPYPSGDPVNNLNSKTMKFVIEKASKEVDPSIIPPRLPRYPKPDEKKVAHTRYITMYEYESATGEPTHLFFNGLSYGDRVTETPKQGTSEIWHVINLTDDNHPLHIHLGLFVVVKQTRLLGLDEFQDCMIKKNDALKCKIDEHAKGKSFAAPRNERTWKNVFKMRPGFMTTILVKFSLLHTDAPYPFNATAEPGYVYHCHILDHEDNEMMRPLKILP
uniref:TSA: Wollemia nobilis Ref_Wollemi_Transcript_12520_2257 transcribed RNA sequence n=1 Tax=Wollemia nobilis TaxID=56998 RepID=A0A0C9S805_9CONI